jgi:transcription antitermination factor NusG
MSRSTSGTNVGRVSSVLHLNAAERTGRDVRRARSGAVLCVVAERVTAALTMSRCAIESVTATDLTASVAAVVPLAPVDVLVGRWWVIHTKSRMEKALAADLERLKIGHYLPLLQTRRRYGGRVFDMSLPLFPGYLFLCGQEDDRYATLMTHRAAQVIPVVDQERLKHELRQVYRVTISDEPVDLYPGLRAGQRCRIASGSLQGIEGVVIRRRGLCRVYLGVEVLGQSAELEIDPALLEIID